MLYQERISFEFTQSSFGTNLSGHRKGPVERISWARKKRFIGLDEFHTQVYFLEFRGPSVSAYSRGERGGFGPQQTIRCGRALMT